MLRIGLTGGIASGKSTVANLFAELGVPIIDTDAVARELVTPGSAALSEIVDSFGPDILTPTGDLDRRKLRRLVFADDGLRRRLEAILHPLIRAETLARIEEIEAPYVVLVVPLLFESGFDRIVDRSMVVDCPEDLQVARIIVRDGPDKAEARAIIGAQMPRDQRRAAADDVIENDGSLDSLRSRVAEFNRHYLCLARNCSGPSSHAE